MHRLLRTTPATVGVSEYAADTKKAMDAKHMQIEREIALFENQTEHVNRTLRAKGDAVDQTERADQSNRVDQSDRAQNTASR